MTTIPTTGGTSITVSRTPDQAGAAAACAAAGAILGAVAASGRARVLFASAPSQESMLRAERIDLTCMGFGVNGHIAFNEPGSDLDDSRFVRRVELTPESRWQQVSDGLFEQVDEVPPQAITLTVPALLSAGPAVVTAHTRGITNRERCRPSAG